MRVKYSKDSERERRVLYSHERHDSATSLTTSRGTFYPWQVAKHGPSRDAYFGKADEEWIDLSSASTPFRPSDLPASRFALFSLFRSFLARLSSGVSSFRLFFDLVFFPLFLARSSRHFSSK